MYESFFGLSGNPFSLLPDANFLYLSKRHNHVLNLLEYGSLTHSGFMVITGDVGAGKTTVIRHFMRDLPGEITVGLITNPSKGLGSLLAWITKTFEIEGLGRDDASMYHAFIAFLVDEYAKDRRVVIIIDEAQNLPSDMLEELRMLSNVNNESDQLLQIVLVGQPELLATLKRPDLRQFVQRISAHCNLTALDAYETAAYIRYRLGVVGGSDAIFDDIACAAAYFFTFGVPRLINMLCDQALMYAFAEDEKFVTFYTVLEVVNDRSTSGLTAFRAVANDQPQDDLLQELETILDQIRTVRADPELAYSN